MQSPPTAIVVSIIMILAPDLPAKVYTKSMINQLLSLYLQHEQL